MDLETLAIIWIISALVGAIIGNVKGRTVEGFVLGLLLGLIGVLISALLSKTPAKKAEEIAEMRAVMGTAPVAGGWWPDPHGRHQLRYWDGTRWTEHVSDAGVTSVDS